MNRFKTISIFAVALLVMAATIWTGLQPVQTLRAATPVTGAMNAKAGSGGVTKGLFVKLSAAGTIVASTGVGDSVVGVCELTAAADALTRYAPAGTQTTVTSGETIAVGDLLTTGTGSKAFVLDTDDASTQRIVAMAMTAASGADEDVTVIVLASAAEQHNDLPDITIESASVDDATTPQITTATGKTNTGYFKVAGKTSGSAKLTCADATAQDITINIAAQTTGAATATLKDMGGSNDDLVLEDLSQTLTNKTVDGDDNTVQDLGITVPKVLVAGGDSEVGLPFMIIFEPAAAGTLSYTVPSGKKLRVLDAYGFKTVGAGAHADDELTLQNNDGSAANIFDKEELNAIGDKARILFDNLDDAERDVAAGHTLDLVALENAGGGCDVTLYVLCVWVTP